jgi:hypothetical protein
MWLRQLFGPVIMAELPVKVDRANNGKAVKTLSFCLLVEINMAELPVKMELPKLFVSGQYILKIFFS